MKRCPLCLSLSGCLVLLAALALQAQAPSPDEKVTQLPEFEEGFRLAAAQSQLSPQMQEELLFQFKREYGRRVIPVPELRAAVLELLYQRGIPYTVAQNFLGALRDYRKTLTAPLDTGFLEAVRHVNLEDRTVHKVDRVRGVTPPRPVQQPLPLYTDSARRWGIEGHVLLEALVLEDGSIANAKVIRGLGYGLDESAVLTIQDRWKFQPGTLDGEAVPVKATIEVNFRLY
jgi:TonB family protein